VALVRIDVSEEHTASIVRVERISDVTSKKTALFSMFYVALKVEAQWLKYFFIIG
jgi:hypothetical protein